MGDMLIPIAIAGGGVAYLLSKQGAVTAPGATAYQTPTGGATMGNIVNGIPNGGGGYYDPYLDDSGQAGFNIDGRLTDPDARQKLDLLNTAMEAAYSKMSAAAKSAAADQMNSSLNLDPPLRGNESWETVARVSAGAAGTAACNAYAGIGTAIAPLCGMAAAYLGVKLENWMETEVPGLQSWISDNVGAVIDHIGDALSDAYHSIF